MTERHAGGRVERETGHPREATKQGRPRRRNSGHDQQANPFRQRDSGGGGIGEFIVGKRPSVSQNAALLLANPEPSERQGKPHQGQSQPERKPTRRLETRRHEFSIAETARLGQSGMEIDQNLSCHRLVEFD